MELSKEVHGLLDRIKRLSNAQKPLEDFSYNFDMKTSYSTLDDIDFNSDELIPIENIDFTDKETWLYVSEDSSTNTESSDLFCRDMTKGLSRGDASSDYESDGRKNFDPRTFTRPKKRTFHLDNKHRSEELRINEMTRTAKINGSRIKEELYKIEQIKMPENPFEREIEKDGSILTGPLHFKLSDPVFNQSFDKILLESEGHDSFINMEPPSLMNSLCSSSMMDTSLVQTNSSNSIISNDTSQGSILEFLSPLKSYDNTLTLEGSMKINQSTPNFSRKSNLNDQSTKLNDFNATFSRGTPKNIERLNFDESKELNTENFNQKTALNATFDSKTIKIDRKHQKINQFESDYTQNIEPHRGLAENFEPQRSLAENIDESQRGLDTTFDSNSLRIEDRVQNFDQPKDKERKFDPLKDKFELKQRKTAQFGSSHAQNIESKRGLTQNELESGLNSTFDSKTIKIDCKNQKMNQFGSGYAQNIQQRGLDNTFDHSNSKIEKDKAQNFDDQFDDFRDKKSPKKAESQKQAVDSGTIKIDRRKVQKFGFKGSSHRVDDELDVETSDFMKNEHKRLLNATFDNKNDSSKVYKRNDENLKVKSLNSTYVQLNKTESENDLNLTFSKSKLGLKKPRNITNLPDTFKMSCPDINKSFLKEKSNKLFSQKFSDSQPNLTKNALNQSDLIRNCGAYDGYKNHRLGSTDSLDEKSSSISSSSKESTKILNVGDLDNLARLQEQSLHQVMSTPKPKSCVSRLWDAEIMSPIPRQDEYLSEDSDFTDFSDQCVTARSRSSRPSTASSTTSQPQQKPVPKPIPKPVAANFRPDMTKTKNVPTMVVKPMSMSKPASQTQTAQAASRVRPSGLPRPTSALQTGIPRPVSRIPAPRFNRPQQTRANTMKLLSNDKEKRMHWMDGCY